MSILASHAIPLRNYRTGDRTIERVMPANARWLTLALVRCTTATPTIWPDAACHVAVDLEATFDGGTTWIPAGGWGAYGGIHLRRDGVQATESQARWPYPGGGTIRATVTVINGPCRTQGTITVED